MSNNEFDDKQGSNDTINRRGLFKKYGPYTTPLVVSMLIPSKTYGHTTFQPYSTSQTCIDDPAGGSMHGIGMNGHCMINGAAGGGNTHPVANPGPVS